MSETHPRPTNTALAEIAERDLTATVVPERFLMAAPPFTPTPDPCSHLRAELAAARTAARERSLADAKLMRDAAEGLHYLSQVGESHGLAGMKYRCRSCDAEGPVHNIIDRARDIQHTSDCLVTRLRSAADLIEKGQTDE